MLTVVFTKPVALFFPSQMNPVYVLSVSLRPILILFCHTYPGLSKSDKTEGAWLELRDVNCLSMPLFESEAHSSIILPHLPRSVQVWQNRMSMTLVEGCELFEQALIWVWCLALVLVNILVNAVCWIYCEQSCEFVFLVMLQEGQLYLKRFCAHKSVICSDTCFICSFMNDFECKVSSLAAKNVDGVFAKCWVF